ncbi:MAG: GHKL domain-containing protein, partial [Thermoanaerobacteraceae bacterium]|nr:GHKL domain-containing protein [Thermoanaerobacteraceae bacterium]
MFPIPWYVVVFESIPEGFMVIYLSLKLMKEEEVIYSKVTVIAVIYGIITFVVRNLTAHIHIATPPYLHTVLLIITLAVLMKYIYKIDFQSGIISVFIVSAIFGLVQYIFVLSLIELLEIDYNSFNEFPWYNIILFIPVAVITFYVVNLYCLNEGARKMDKGTLIALFAVVFQLMTVLMLNQILFASNLDIYYKNLPIIVIALSAIAFIFYLSLKYIQTSSKKETELELLKYHLKDVEEFIKILRAERHENMKNMQTIQSLAFLGKNEELMEYLNKIVGHYRSNVKLLRLGDMALTALVNVKMEMMQRNNINFEVRVNGLGIYNTKLDSVELTTVIGNVLDNAIEAVIERKSDRMISLEVDENERFYIVKIANNGPAIKTAD